MKRTKASTQTAKKTKYVPKAIGKIYKKPNPSSVFNRVNLGKGFPLTLQITHKYAEVFTLQSVSGTISNYKFSCNGMFLPNQTGTGHQPMYFDQLTAVYDHYTVIKSTFKATLTPTTVTTVPITVGLYVNDDTTATPGIMGVAVESLFGTVAVFPQGASISKIVSASWDGAKVFGGDPMGDPNLTGTYSSNPPESSIYNLCLQSMDIASTVNIYTIVQIEYTAIWDELKDCASS